MSPSTLTIQQRTIGIVASSLGLKEEALTLTSRLTKDLGADSLEVAEILIALEDTFKVDLLDINALSHFVTVNDVVEAVEVALDVK